MEHIDHCNKCQQKALRDRIAELQERNTMLINVSNYLLGRKQISNCVAGFESRSTTPILMDMLAAAVDHAEALHVNIYSKLE